MLCNNVGLISKCAKDVASESPENRRFRLPHCRLTPRLQGSREYPHKPLPEIRVFKLHLRRWKYVYLHSNFRGGLRKTHVFWNRAHNGPSRSSKVVDFGTNRKRVCDFLLVINSNLGSILPRLRDIAGFLLRRATPPLFHPNFRGVPLGLDCRCCVEVNILS